jgi:hypothetical protein
LHFEGKKHWTNGSGWGMVKAMHDIIFTFIKTIMQGVNFFFANELLLWTTNNGPMSMFIS